MTCAQKEGLLSEAAAEEVGLFKPMVGEYVHKTYMTPLYSPTGVHFKINL